MKKWLIPGKAYGRYKVSPGYLVMTENKEIFQTMISACHTGVHLKDNLNIKLTKTVMNHKPKEKNRNL